MTRITKLLLRRYDDFQILFPWILNLIKKNEVCDKDDRIHFYQMIDEDSGGCEGGKEK